MMKENEQALAKILFIKVHPIRKEGKFLRILFIGDITGNPGRQIIEKKLYQIQQDYAIDFTIANGENATNGFGLNKKVFEQLSVFGIDAFTMGNHTWDNKELATFIDQEKTIVRPLNYPANAPGQGFAIFTLPDGQKLAIINLIGQYFMTPTAFSPFTAVTAALSQISSVTPNILVDLHAEATSEKVAMGWYLDGRVSALVGTHTHIQTNDARILPRGTAYITDVGMTGAHDSVLGMDKDIALERFLTQMPVHFRPAEGDLQLNAVVIELNQEGRAGKIETLQMVEPSL